MSSPATAERVHELTRADFDQSGYPDIDVAALKKIHPGLKSLEDDFRAA